MNDGMRCTLYCLKGLLDNMFSRLCEHLNRYILRNHVALDKCSHKIVFRVGCSRETDLNLLKAYIHKHLEEVKLLFKAHRLNECLISVS